MSSTDFTDIAAEYYPGSSKTINREPTTTETVAAPEPSWDDRPRVYTMNGTEGEFFTVGMLAEALGRKPGTIRKWEREGLIPKATYQAASDDPRGRRRLYSRAQVEGIVAIAKDEGIYEHHERAITRTQFTARVVALFKALAAS